MSKTETVHTRVAPETKEKADAIFAGLGLTTSQAISLFLNASVNRNGFPFELVLPSKEDEDLEFASAIASVDGVPPTEETKRIFKLYKQGQIDLETAKFAIKRLASKQ